MWVFLSRRIRNWLLLAVALPVLRSLVHRLATARQERSPDARATRLLGHADSGLIRLHRVAARRRGKSVQGYA
jgi:hypothetical protein